MSWKKLYQAIKFAKSNPTATMKRQAGLVYARFFTLLREKGKVKGITLQEANTYITDVDYASIADEDIRSYTSINEIGSDSSEVQTLVNSTFQNCIPIPCNQNTDINARINMLLKIQNDRDTPWYFCEHITKAIYSEIPYIKKWIVEETFSTHKKNTGRNGILFAYEMREYVQMLKEIHTAMEILHPSSYKANHVAWNRRTKPRYI